MPIHDKAEDVATYVRYERQMFDLPFKGIKQGLPNQFQKNIYLESFLVHTRNLRDFLFSPPRGDDVSATHFFEPPDAEWDESVKDWCPYLDANKSRLNKSLAHLSYERIGYEPYKGWDCGVIHTEMTAAWNEFWSRLTAEKQEWFTRDRDSQP